MSRRLLKAVIMGLIAIAVGVAIAFAASFPEGVITTGLRITPLAGEGEGEVDENAIVFTESGSRIAFQGAQSMLEFYDEWSVIVFYSWLGLIYSFGGIDILGEGSLYLRANLNDPEHNAFLGMSDDFFLADIAASYEAVLLSQGVVFLTGPTGAVTVGEFVSDPGGPNETNHSGVYAVASSTDLDLPRALMHVGPTGGLTLGSEGEGESETGPVAQMSVFAPDDSPTPTEMASLRLKSNLTEGEITMHNAASAGITVSGDGSVIIELGDAAETIGNSETLQGARSLMRPAASNQAEAPPRIGIHSLKIPLPGT